jgi:aspartyl aminopeptidase
MTSDVTSRFNQFLKKATTSIQTVQVVEQLLEQDGFSQLFLENSWHFTKEGKYYVKPYESLLIAFTVPDIMAMPDRFKIITNHVDSPAFKIKPNPEIVSDGYLKLNTEVYGSPILNTWLDRPLSIAGKVALKSADIFKPRFKYIDFAEPILTIPNVAIHLNSEMNNGVKFDRQNDLQPLIGTISNQLEKEEFLIKEMAKRLDIEKEEILDFDLFVYVVEEAMAIGIHKEFLSGPRLDNLTMVYTSIQSLIKTESSGSINMVACFDNEEVGSESKQGARSSLLSMITERIFMAYEKEKEQYYRALPNSFIISSDGVHGTHPNQKSKNDPTNTPVLNGGVAIKLNGNKRYATDCESSAVLQQLCQPIGVNLQKYVNHSEIRGGTTVGPITETVLPIRTVDMGLPMLAMHSARELVGVKDLQDCEKIFSAFFK